MGIFRKVKEAYSFGYANTKSPEDLATIEAAKLAGNTSAAVTPAVGAIAPNNSAIATTKGPATYTADTPIDPMAALPPANTGMSWLSSPGVNKNNQYYRRFGGRA